MVPTYLLPIADRIIVKGDTTTFYLKCTCGGDAFLLAKSKKNENERDNEFDRYWDSFKLPIFSLKETTDKNGESYIYGTTFFGIRLGKFYVKDLPRPNTRHIIKAKCCQCGSEFIIFDNLHHGYDAITEYERQADNYVPKFIWTKNTTGVIVMVRNDLSYDEFSEEFGDSMEKYANAFESIDIYTMINGRKKKFFEEETA